MEQEIKVLMCGSDVVHAKGGMVSVIKNYLSGKGFKGIHICYVPTHIDGSVIRKSIYFAVSYIKIAVLLMRGQADAAHLHVSERGSFFRKAYLLRLVKRFGVPVLLHHHGAEFFPFYESLSPKKRAYVKDIILKADLNLVLSEFTERQYKAAFPGIRTAVLFNGVPVPDRNQYNPDGKHIVTLGRLGTRKGTYDLIEAIKILDPGLPADFCFDLCGDGETAGAADRAAQAGVRGRIGHLGWIEGRDKDQLMGECCIHVLPSYNEGLPMSILETMAAGIPNISTRIAAIPEVIEHGVNGFLVEPGDVEALTLAIQRLALDPLLRKRFSRAAYEKVAKQFSFERTSRELERIYREMAGVRDEE